MKQTLFYKIITDKSFQKAFLVCLIFLIAGYVMLKLGLANYGLFLFIILPLGLGFSLNALPNWKWVVYGAAVALVSFLLSIVVAGLEGLLCVAMAVVAILPFIFLGYALAFLVTRYRKLEKEHKFKVLLFPLVVFIFGAPIEKWMTAAPERFEIKTEILLPYSSTEVYNAIKSVDTLTGQPTILMKLGLPIPRKCVLEKETIGGKRTCYFDGGTIEEVITHLEKGRTLDMDVVDYNLTGTNWLNFHRAIYKFEAIAESQCRLTRITVYSSTLRPEFYWRPLTEEAINEEHGYVFKNLERDLMNLTK